MIVLLRHLVGWLIGAFSVPRRPHFGEPRAWSAIADSPCQATAASAGSLDRVFWVSLRKLWSGGRNHFCSSPQKRWCVGIASASGCIGLGFREIAALRGGNP